MAQHNSQSAIQFNPAAALSGVSTIDTRDVSYFDNVGIILAGAFVGTVLAEVSNDNGTNWVAISVRDEVAATPSTRLAGATGITGPGAYSVRIGEFSSFRLRCSAYTSGTPTVGLFYTISDISA